MLFGSLVALLFGCSSWAAPHQKDSLTASYRSLRNADSSVQKLDEWYALAGKYLQAVSTRKIAVDDGLFRAGLLMREVCRQREIPRACAVAVELFSNLVVIAPQSTLADDALFSSGEMLSRDLGRPEMAIAVWKQCVERYPNSDATLKAKQSLSQESRHTAIPLAQASKLPLVILDPGQGGEDEGARSPDALFEKDVTLLLARTMQRLAKKVEIQLSRESDLFVPLDERVALANDRDAVAFVSLHANASERRDRSGSEVYILDGKVDAAAKLLAERENGGASDPTSLFVSELVQRSKKKESRALAEALRQALRVALKKYDPRIGAPAIKSAPFYVLVGAHMPSVLVEVLYIDHERDSELLSQRRFIQDVAIELTKAIEAFVLKGSR